MGNILKSFTSWVFPYSCISLRPDGKPCKAAVKTPSTRCERCWTLLAASPNGLLRVKVATELDSVRGVSADAFARLINDPVTAVRVAVMEHTPRMSSGWQEHVADDPEPVMWRALAQREDLASSAATKLLSCGDDFTFGYLLENPHSPVSVIRWIATHHTGPIADEAKKKLAEPLVPKRKKEKT